MLRTVRTSLGWVEGIAAPEPEITVFRGIPFAAPPVGDLRWRAPRPAEPWTGTLTAHDFAPACPQPTPGDSNAFYDREWGTDPAIALDEDCLYLNVWTPALRGRGPDARVAADRPLPVMVWIHGGAYQTGCTAEKEFDGSALARRGVVVVSVAYRLNVFGFLAHNRLREESLARGDGEPYANFGLLDQRAGIRWVRGNIAAFGGDPENITVFGQSAGAGGVLAQICSPTNRGLFGRAIMQSGAGLGMFNRRQQSFEDGHRTAERLFAALGVPSLDAARQVPAAELLAAAEALPVLPESDREGDWPMMVNWTPCVDGRFLTDQFARTIARGDQNEVEIMLGNTTGEFMEADTAGTPLPAGEVGNLKLIAEWIRSGRKAPYYYRFDVTMPGDDAGAFHSSELWFSFGTLDTCWRPFVGWHYDLSRRMIAYWTNFAATGDPNGPDTDGTPLPEWTRYAPFGDDAMRLGRRTRMIRDWSTNAERNALLQWGGAATN
ncbi:carboxylesterase/lipase family protein [Bifidobacterium phasiani]|uniref:Carboxylic ester hydrolase n=1 Tax=Bifidobacterium phasiani TaxID=2834431 RepID=A0ABS6WAE9_9BIFI|nr:carboxylesterase family protein [Bifidobacterium phasiani]MBW3083483.1 carboxylesterase family protein [Bifidobacterium phasiani]